MLINYICILYLENGGGSGFVSNFHYSIAPNTCSAAVARMPLSSPDDWTLLIVMFHLRQRYKKLLLGFHNFGCATPGFSISLSQRGQGE